MSDNTSLPDMIKAIKLRRFILNLME